MLPFGRRRGTGPAARFVAPASGREVRLLAGADAAAFAEAKSRLLAVDQAIEALTVLNCRPLLGVRRDSAPGAIIDLALLRYGVVQFIECFEAGPAAGLPGPCEVLPRAEGWPAFYRHLCAFRNQLTGPQARLVGLTEPVAFLRRIRDRPILAGIATRTRRPDRLTRHELSQIIGFMAQVRNVWAGRVEELRDQVLDQTRNLDPDQLDSLAPAMEL